MTYCYWCDDCGFIGVIEEGEPIIRLPFSNPHRRKCPECGREMVGEPNKIDSEFLSDC